MMTDNNTKVRLLWAYKDNQRFRDYVDMAGRKSSVEEVLEHKITEIVLDYYESEETG